MAKEHRLIVKPPNVYNAVPGEGGVVLSRGQNNESVTFEEISVSRGYFISTNPPENWMSNEENTFTMDLKELQKVYLNTERTMA